MKWTDILAAMARKDVSKIEQTKEITPTIYDAIWENIYGR